MIKKNLPYTSFDKKEIPEDLQIIGKGDPVRCYKCGKRLFDGELPDKPITVKCTRSDCKALNTFQRL